MARCATRTVLPRLWLKPSVAVRSLIAWCAIAFVAALLGADGQVGHSPECQGVIVIFSSITPVAPCNASASACGPSALSCSK